MNRQGTADPSFQRQCTSEPRASAMSILDRKGGDMAEVEANILRPRIVRQQERAGRYTGGLLGNVAPHIL